LVSLDELLATALGSAVAALLLSRLGAAGTILGATLAPVIITLTRAVVSYELSRAREVVRGTPLRGAPWWSGRSLATALSGRRLLSALLTAAAAFAIAAIGISVAEAIVGKPVNRWGRNGGSGYTFGDPKSGQSPTNHTTTTPATTTPSGRQPATKSAPTATPERTAPQQTQTQPRAAETSPRRQLAPSSTTPTP
jgi:amino acid transporter